MNSMEGAYVNKCKILLSAVWKSSLIPKRVKGLNLAWIEDVLNTTTAQLGNCKFPVSPHLITYRKVLKLSKSKLEENHQLHVKVKVDQINGPSLRHLTICCPKSSIVTWPI